MLIQNLNTRFTSLRKALRGEESYQENFLLKEVRTFILLNSAFPKLPYAAFRAALVIPRAVHPH